MHEMYVLKLSEKCPRIIHLHEVYETSTEVNLVLELAAGGELQRVLEDQEVIAEMEAARLMRQILEGVDFLHRNNIAHLDIKPQNLLLTGSTLSQYDVKLCDFGISRLILKGSEIREILGTPDYVSPEILQYEPISLATDMWSIGVLAYVLLSGHTPFGGETKQETFWNITSGILEFPEEIFCGVSNDAKDFIQRLLITEPNERMTAKESLCHSWIKKFCNPENTEEDLSRRSLTDEATIEASNVSAEFSKEFSKASGVMKSKDSVTVEVVEGTFSCQPHLLPMAHHQRNGINEKEVVSSSDKPHSRLSTLNSTKSRGVSEMGNMMAELEGLSLNKCIIITDDRMSVVC
ncbi:serine/threonine-protein kinase 17B-like isoform X2 [Tachypleus tridentatus]